MTPEEVGRAYDRIAERWSGHAFPRDNAIGPHERAIAFVGERRRALDVGCGASGRIVELLAGHGFEVEGLDVSSRMLELAARRDPEVRFHHADICQWTLPCKYDLISAWDSLWHVPLDDHERVLRKLLDGLSPEGVLSFTAGGVDPPGEHVDDHMGPAMYYSSLGLSRTLRVIDDAGSTCRHLEYDQYPEQHIYVIAQRC